MHGFVGQGSIRELSPPCANRLVNSKTLTAYHNGVHTYLRLYTYKLNATSPNETAKSTAASDRESFNGNCR